MSNNKFSNPGLITVIKELYLNEFTADVHFTFNSNGKCVRIPAHKCLLVVTSNVFHAMFSGLWREKNEVAIVDATPAAFREFLQFFYDDEVELTNENIEEVLGLGQKYLVPACVKASTLVLMKILTNENVCPIYGLSILNDVMDLKKLCEARISLNATDIFKTRGFLECHRQILNYILQLESLSCSEMAIFEACMEWVSVASKSKILDKRTVRTHLEDTFYEIRLGLIKDQLDDCLSSHEIKLTDDLRLELNREIESNDVESKMFRLRVWDWDATEQVVCARGRRRLTYVNTSYNFNKPYEIRKPEVTTFSTNTVLLLQAIVIANVYAVKVDDDEYTRRMEGIDSLDATLTIFEGTDEIRNQSGSNQIKLILDTRPSNVYQLRKPIPINPGVNYTISLLLDADSAGLDPADAFDGNLYTDFELKNNEVNVGDDITVQFTNDAELYETDRNFIYGLHFSRL